MARWRILIVDDEDDIRSIVRATLGSKYEIVEAHDGIDALAKLELAEPDFVVLDVMMPLMDGFETCEAIRKHPRFNRTSVLFLSALNSKEDMKKGYGAGANLYLTKPFDPSRLLRNVDLFFETNPPPVTRKRHTIEELRDLEKRGPDALAKAESQGLIDSLLAQPPVNNPLPAQGSIAINSGTGSSVSDANEPPVVHSNIPRVLAVDDDPDVLIVVRSSLEPQFEVFVANNGIEAIEKITTFQPDLLVLDAMMPKMSGYQLCQSLRRNVRFSKTPMLFLSGKATARDREYAIRIGANDFLAKPFEPQDLYARVKGLMSLPGFVIHPKSISKTHIQVMENKKKAELEEHRDRLHRKEESELEKFLRENT